MSIATGNMSASQESHFESRLLAGSGAALASWTCGCVGFDCTWATGTSEFQATFTIDHPTRFDLVSDFWAPALQCRGEMTFSGPTGVIVTHLHSGTDDLSGELGPGEYQFSINARSCVGSCMGCIIGPDSYFDFTLELRRFGDADGDSNVDVNDLLAVIGEWGQCPPKAACDSDLNASGAVDVDDLLEIISHWGS